MKIYHIEKKQGARLTLMALLCAVVLGVAGIGHAGIIVTEGYVNSNDEEEEEESCTPGADNETANQTVDGVDAVNDDDSTCLQGQDEEGLSLEEEEGQRGLMENTDSESIEDLDTPPGDDWDCEILEGGVEYCEPATDDNGTGEVGDEMTRSRVTQMSCSTGDGSGPLAPWLPVMAALLWLFPLRRRVSAQSETRPLKS